MSIIFTSQVLNINQAEFMQLLKELKVWGVNTIQWQGEFQKGVILSESWWYENFRIPSNLKKFLEQIKNLVLIPPRITNKEIIYWQMDMRINNRGIHILQGEPKSIEKYETRIIN